MVHSWAQAKYGNNATIGTVLFDYRKVFDLIDHRILVDKLSKFILPTRIINSIIDFLSGRSQRIKLAEGCYSKWGSVPSGIPQGTKLGPWLFLILINDLTLNGNFKAQLWKYVDNTTTSEVVAKGGASNAQHIADLQCELERVHKRALLIICPSLSYDEALNEAGILTIISYCEDICDKVFNVALGNKDNKLNKLLTEANKVPYFLRNHRHFALPKWKTDRFKNTFILSSCLKYNEMIRFECFYLSYA